MSLDSDVELLRQISFFDGFSGEHLKLIAFSAENRSLPEKLLLYDEGQLMHSAYVIIGGGLAAERKEQNSGKVVKRDIGPGMMIAEQSLILDMRATESMRVKTRTHVLQIRKAMFRRLLQEYPEIARVLRSRLVRHVMQLSGELDQVADRLRAVEA